MARHLLVLSATAEMTASQPTDAVLVASKCANSSPGMCCTQSPIWSAEVRTRDEELIRHDCMAAVSEANDEIHND